MRSVPKVYKTLKMCVLYLGCVAFTWLGVLYILHTLILAEKPDPQDKLLSLCVQTYIACTQTNHLGCVDNLGGCVDKVIEFHKEFTK